MQMKQTVVGAVAVVSALLLAAPAGAAVVFEYVAGEASVEAAPGGTVAVDLFLRETVTDGDASVLADDGGLFGFGLLVEREAGSAAALASASVDPAFDFPGDAEVEVGRVRLGGGVFLNDPAAGDVDGGVTLVRLGQVMITAGGEVGETRFGVGPTGDGGLTVTDAGTDLDAGGTSVGGIAFEAAIGTSFVVSVVPEPAAALLLAPIALLLRRRGS